MKAWEYVINTAMLGTDKQMPGKAELPDEIAAIATLIDALESSDKEAKFLQKAAVIYNYRQSGFTPVEQKDLPVNIAPDEVKPYCSTAAAKVLNDILNDDNTTLLELWLGLCNDNGKLFLPDVLPVLLDLGLKHKSIQALVTACSGNRGLWLSKLNPAWDYFTTLPDEEIWQTGKPEERVALLKKLRATNPDTAREWLMQTWPQEPAAAKVELLKTLYINLSAADLPWLESVQTEKGQKVKDEVLNLLKHIPGSSILKRYEDILRQSVILKKEKALFGMMNKTVIQQKLSGEIDESIFKSGIEKLSGPAQKNMTDESFIIYQLVELVPPSFWETQFDATPGQVVGYFEKYADTLTGALGNAVSRFKFNDWMPLFLDQDDKLFSDYVNVLPVARRDKYLLKFFKSNANYVIGDALRCTQEWGAELAFAVISEMANDPYQYNRAALSRHINLIPVAVLPQLDRIAPGNTNLQNAWEKNRDHLIKLLGLKQQTLKAFNA